MIIDGNKINEEIREELKAKILQAKIAGKLSLAVVWVGDDPVTAKYVKKKEEFGKEIGVQVNVYKYGSGIMTSELAEEVRRILRRDPSGIIVQLPLPNNIDSSEILNMIPINKDVDLLSDRAYQNFVDGKSVVLPPVTGVIKEILERGEVRDLRGLYAVVVGRGRLVGKPAAAWLVNQGARVELLGRDTEDVSVFTKEADIIIAGAGVPKLIKPDMVKSGAIIIDAATTEESGKIVGDVVREAGDSARIFAPVPGGVGPMTVAMLFKNLLMLHC